MRVYRQSKLLGLTTDVLVVDCKQQAVLRCRSCGGHSLVVVSGQSHQLRWCSQCVSQLMLTTFDDKAGNPKLTRQKITRWVDNGSVQLIETPERTLIITFREPQPLSDKTIQNEGKLIMKNFKTSPFVVIGMTVLLFAICSGGSNSSAQTPSESAPTPTPTTDRRRIIEGYASEFYAGGRVVGTCDTIKGCNALKAACNRLKNRTFKSVPGGSRGACVEQADNSGSSAKLENNPGAQSSEPGRVNEYYIIKLNDASGVVAYVPDAANFLADPVGTLKQNGFAVPPPAERHWRSLTVALRRLSNPKLPSAPQAPIISRALVKNEVIKNEVVRVRLPRGSIPVVGDWDGDGATSVGDFLSDPVVSLRAQGVNVPVIQEPAWRQLAGALNALRRAYASPEPPSEPARDRFYRTKPHVNVSADDEGAGEQAVNGQSDGGAVEPVAEPSDKAANAGQPDLMIKQFLFPPTDEKVLRAQVMNQGSAASKACRLFLTIRKIDGTPAGRRTHVNIPALAPGKTVWLVVDAKGILPVSLSLEATTFKLNADATGIVAESDETNNEVWHNR